MLKTFEDKWTKKNDDPSSKHKIEGYPQFSAGEKGGDEGVIWLRKRGIDHVNHMILIHFYPT